MKPVMTFFIGQRVRIIHSPQVRPDLRGRATTIKALPGAHLAFPDHYELDITEANGAPLVCQPQFVTPIVYDGAKPGSWEKCPWLPNGFGIRVAERILAERKAHGQA